MVQKPYDWAGGVSLPAHSQRKHKVIREYFADYLRVRCQVPQQSKFRLAVADGFAGGGRYRCGTPGSPLIFIEELERASETLNIQRAANGMAHLEIECLLIFNDLQRDAIEILKTHVAPLEAKIKDAAPSLHIRVEYMNTTFEAAYRKIGQLLDRGRYMNVLFNLDQAGEVHVERSTLVNIMQSYQSTESFYTFMIESLLAFLKKQNPLLVQGQLARFGITADDLREIDGALLSKPDWLGAAERIVFNAFQTCAPYVSPFSINNPDGWRYWLIHFANRPRARQVYNNVLHENSTLQAHFGRSGLDMLAYDPAHAVGDLYLFDDRGRKHALTQLLEDIPRRVSQNGDAISVEELYASIYNMTPAHSDDVNTSIIENPDIEVITPAGGERRKAGTITIGDIIKLKRQRSFFPMFLSASDPKKPR